MWTFSKGIYPEKPDGKPLLPKDALAKIWPAPPLEVEGGGYEK